MERPLSWLPEAPNSLSTDDIIEIQQNGSAVRYKMSISDLVTGMYDKLFPKSSKNKNAIEVIEDRLTALDDETTGKVTVVEAIVGDESEGLVKTVADATNKLADVMKPGPPEPATTKASLVVGTTNTITFEAKTAGTVGNNITVVMSAASGPGPAPLSIGVDGSRIGVELAINEKGDVTTTLAEVAAAITNDQNPAYSADVAALITAVVDGVGTTICPSVETQTPLAGGLNDGTVAGKGATMFDDDYIYVAIDDCDGSVDMSNWKKIALAAFSE